MSAGVEFLERLLGDGTARLTARPHFDAGTRAEAGSVLADAFSRYRLSIAGPLLDFDAPAALAAAEVVWHASWFLLVRDEEPATVEQALQLPAPGRQPGQHLSADLTLRYLPQIHQRARGIAADDVLTRSLERILRHWPLAGVLADLHEPPLFRIEELEHPGLLLLYAERLADHPRREWTPRDGPARDWVDRVFDERKNGA
jgi:hypothetical protein